jgi:YVTN family beta-propeller protein
MLEAQARGGATLADLPTGTVTFLFTDLEGSTRLLKELGRDRYARLLEEHQRLLRSGFEEAGGHEIDTQGDAFFVAFGSAAEAIRAAEAGQLALAGYSWPTAATVRVRIGIHTGEPAVGPERYIGLGVHKAARICAAGHGGQVLLSKTTHDLVEDEESAGIAFKDLGEQRLKDLDRPERIYQLVIPGLPSEFPPLRTLEAQPMEATPFAGRESELAEAAQSAVEAPRRRRRGELLGAALAGVLAAAIAIPVFALGRGDSGAPAGRADVSIVPNSVAVIDAQTAELAADIHVGRVPGPVVFGQGAVWVGNFEDKTVSRIDPRTRRTMEALGIGVRPWGLAVGEGALWIANRGFSATRAGTSQPATVRRLDIARGQSMNAIEIARGGFGTEETPKGAPSVAGHEIALLARGMTLWVGTGDSRYSQLVKIDAASNKLAARLNAFDGSDLAAANGSIWAVSSLDATLTRIDPETNRALAKITVGALPCCVAAGAGSLWVTGRDNDVWRIDPDSNTVEKTISVGDHPLAIAAGPSAVWVANYGDASVSRIDPKTNQVRTIELGRRPVGIALGGGAVWITVD